MATARLGGGLEGAQSVMRAIQRSQDALVHTDVTQQAVLAVGGPPLLAAATLMVEEGDRDGFEAYLIPCAYHPEIGAELLALVARAYPRQVSSVVAELRAAVA